MKGFVDEPLRSSIGDADPLRWLADQRCEVVRDKPGRRTIRFQLNGASYFAKIHAGPSFGEVLKELASWRTPPLDAGREARALAHLAARSVPVPRLVAWGVRGRWPGRLRSFLVTEDVGTQRTAGDALRSTPNGALGARRRLIRQIGELTRALHAAGVNHRDLYLGHILAHEIEDGTSTLTLIDLHRAQIWNQIPRRWLAKDLGCLAFDAQELGLSSTDQLRFARAYTGDLPGTASALRSEPGPWRRALARAARLMAERQRKGPEFGG